MAVDIDNLPKLGEKGHLGQGHGVEDRQVEYEVIGIFYKIDTPVGTRWINQEDLASVSVKEAQNGSPS